MKCNVGKTDKVIRFVLGGVLIIGGIVAHNWWGLIGLLLIITALINWCPLYALLGSSTCSGKCECEKK